MLLICKNSSNGRTHLQILNFQIWKRTVVLPLQKSCVQNIRYSTWGSNIFQPKFVSRKVIRFFKRTILTCFTLKQDLHMYNISFQRSSSQNSFRAYRHRSISRKLYKVRKVIVKLLTTLFFIFLLEVMRDKRLDWGV